jgi:hypothetical protein
MVAGTWGWKHDGHYISATLELGEWGTCHFAPVEAGDFLAEDLVMEFCFWDFIADQFNLYVPEGVDYDHILDGISYMTRSETPEYKQMLFGKWQWAANGFHPNAFIDLERYGTCRFVTFKPEED